MTTSRIAFAGVFLALAWPVPSSAQPQEPSTAERVALAAFTAAERELIRSYFHEHGPPGGHEDGHPGGKPPHRKRGRGLPPGIAKNLARGKPLPPGIAKRALPPGLLEQLPRREGFEHVYVDGRVLLVEAGTQIVHDVLVDVLLED